MTPSQFRASAAMTLGVLACASLAVSCAAIAPRQWYDASRTRAHVEMLAGRIGKRPHGSDAAARARDYVVEELRSMGFAVRVQVAEAVAPDAGLTTRVANVIALKSGAERDAVALVSHYDSQPEAPGGLDDALGVAVSLEAARELVRTPLRRSLYVIVTDAEEVGLMGARAAIDDVDVRANVRAFLNFDGTGASGPGLLFQAGPGFGAPLRAWADGAWRPEGGSFSIEIYRRLPNDTDFTIFAETGASGLNFAPVVDSYAYHTDRDIASRVRDATLRQETINAVETIRELDARDLATTSDTATYFGWLGRIGVAYGAGAATAVNLVASGTGAIAWIWIVVTLWRRGGGLAILVTWLTAVAVVLVSALALAAVAWGLRAARAELHPWYAAPYWLFVASALTAVGAGWSVMRIAASVPARWRGLGGAAAVWCVALPPWIALAIALRRSAPSASYLVEWPLIAAAAAAVAATRVPGRGGRGVAPWLASVVVIAAASFWLVDTWRLLSFMVPLFGWLPIVTPVYLYGAVIGLAMLMIVPPIAALMSRPGVAQPVRPRSARLGQLAWGGALLAGVLASMAPAYTEDRPHRRAVRFVQDDVSGGAWWEVGGYERALGLAGADGAPARWEPVSDFLPTVVRLDQIAKPFRFRASATPVAGAWPADVAATVSVDADRATYALRVRPSGVTGLRVALPGTAPPLASSLAGVPRGGRWTASYAAVPADGLDVTIAVPAADRARLDDIVLVLISPDPPGALSGAGWPAWLPTSTMTWTTRSIRIVRGPLELSRAR